MYEVYCNSLVNSDVVSHDLKELVPQVGRTETKLHLAWF